MSLVELDERPYKRRKTSPLAHENELETSALTKYLTLSESAFRIQTSDLKLHNALLQSPVPCAILNCRRLYPNNDIELDVRIPTLKTTLAIHIDVDSTTKVDLLYDATRLPILQEKNKVTTALPVACVASDLSYENGEAVLVVELMWLNTARLREKVSAQLLQILARYTNHHSPSSLAEAEAWDVREFYDNVFVPPTGSSEVDNNLDLDLLQCQLYPFQKRATHWLLRREGVACTESGAVVPLANESHVLPLDFRKITIEDSQDCYVSNSLGVLTKSLEDVEEIYRLPRGGILAEGMGLGKTVEMIALMCTHSQAKSPIIHRNPQNLIRSRATLVITPPTILEQWKQEIREHAPSLRVYHYEGVGSKVKRNALYLDELADQDIVLTTYNVIAREVHYVREKPDRNLRNRPRADPPKSPLTQILWFRCLLDEAQMIESGVSNAATVARLIPRSNAWAVTGTPLKQSHRDLYGLLLFLNCDPWCQSLRMWDNLVFYQRPLLRQLIHDISLRHSKETVRHELRIPAQSRQTITIPFTAIEESHYTQMHYDMQSDCGFDRLGAPLEDDWGPNSPVTVEKMRSWLQRLRQTCLHPEVGGRNRKALGRSGGPLRTVAQVLDVMIEQADASVHSEQRTLLLAKISQARMLEHARKSREAQQLFSDIHAEATTVVENCRKDLARQMVDQASAKETLEAADQDDSELSDDENALDSTQLVARQRLRSALEVQHICIFFIGNTFFQLKEADELALSKLEASQSARTTEPTNSKDDLSTEDETATALRERAHELEKAETDSYDKAKGIRRELLAETHKKAERRIRVIREKLDRNSFAPILDLEDSQDDFGGLESRKVFEKFHHFSKALSEQAQQFRKMRENMVTMLTQALVDEDEGIELTGDEYESSTKHQDEMYVVMEMLRALLADRNDAITGQENLLLKQETKSFMKEAKEGKGPAPGLMIKYLNERTAKRIDVAQQGSLRGILTEIRSLATSLEWQEATSTRARSELVLVNKLLQHVQKLLAAQTKAMALLEQEVNEFRNTMNARLSYYGALQQISDTVAPFGEEETIGQPVNQRQFEQSQTDQTLAAKKLAIASSKRRYLHHLRDESVSDESTRICTICQFEFEIGTLTVCGHQFCKECITMWYAEHRNCPVCKRRLTLNDFYDVTYKSTEAAVRKEEALNDATSAEEGITSSKSAKAISDIHNSIYKDIGEATLFEIKNTEIKGHSYGSKVDTLCRHVVYLRDNDPGSKAIIFSQYRDFLDVLGRALHQNGVVYSKFDDKDGIVNFKSNPANQCFLLHAKAHSAGLNLVVANHVILCEPLINTAIELQAIARVHRIGQHRATTVWMYLIADTVEEAIYDISVKRRLAHMTDGKKSKSRSTSRAQTPQMGGLLENDIEAANSKELQAADLSKMFAAGKSGGEMVDKEDLWQCLFGKVKQNDGIGIKMGLLNAPGANAPANGQIGTFLRAEAAERRMHCA